MTDRYEEMKESSKCHQKNDADIESKWHSLFQVRTGIKSGEIWPLVDKEWPLVGKEWPLVGKEWPLVGKEWPLVGKEWPLVGKEWPPTDEI